MKDNLFEILLNLFEKTLAQLRKEPILETKTSADVDEGGVEDLFSPLSSQVVSQWRRAELVQLPKSTSTRVLTYDEQMKLTKPSYQLLMRMLKLGVISSEQFELVMNELMQSDTGFVTTDEVKWTIRLLLAEQLDANQLAFLDLVLYQSEDNIQRH